MYGGQCLISARYPILTTNVFLYITHITVGFFLTSDSAAILFVLSEPPRCYAHAHVREHVPRHPQHMLHIQLFRCLHTIGQESRQKRHSAAQSRLSNDRE